MPDERPLKAVPDLRPRQHRITGDHWWDQDRIAHLADRPRHCPSCGVALDIDHGIAVEYWEGDNRVYHTWCKECGWTGDIIRIRRMVGHEPEDH